MRSPPTPTRPTSSSPRRSAALALARRTPSSCSTSRALRARGRPRRRVPRRRASGSSRRRSRSSRARDSELLQELLDLFAAEYAAGEAARVGARLRGPAAAARATCCATTSASARPSSCASARSWSTSSRTRTALQCELIDLLAAGPARRDVFFVGDEFQSIYGFRHADVDVFRERREAAAQRLPLTRNYRSRPEVLAAVNHLFGEEFGDGYQPLAASGEFPDPVFGHPVELLVTDKRELQATPATHWRDGEAQRDRAARARARRRGRGDAGRDRAALRRRHRRRAVRGGAARRRACRPTARPAAATSASSRSSTCSSYLRLLHNRYDDEALVDRARVAVRRRLERRARADPPARRAGGRSSPASSARCPSALATDDERLVRAFKQRYERLVAASARIVARAAVRGDRLRARLRPRRARAVGRQAPLREPAQADAARALVRGAARRRHRGLRRRSSATRRRSARRSSRRSRRRRAPTRCGC